MFYAWGRLKEGVSVEQARSEIIAIAARIEKLHPSTNAGVGAAESTAAGTAVVSAITRLHRGP